MKKEKGITLVALVVTIIVLLILAGVTISIILNGGIIEKANDASNQMQQAQENENTFLQEATNEIEKHLDGSYTTNNGSNSESGNNSSSVISSVSVTSKAGATLLNMTVSTETQNNAQVIGYHFFVIDSDNASNIRTFVTEENNATISGLSPNTSYRVYAVAYDIQNNCKKSDEQTVTTTQELEKLVPTLKSNTNGIATAFATYTANGRSAYEAFDGNIPPTASGYVAGYMVSSTSNNQIGYDFGEGNEHVVQKIVYYGHPSDANVRYTSIDLEYSDDGTNWSKVQTFAPIVISSYTQVSDLAQEFEVEQNLSAHRYWRINGTNTGYSWSGLLELEFWGF